ncbi:MAG: Zn-ribbon domain-containing OB-fold protein [Acidimicrobiales bacterium]
MTEISHPEPTASWETRGYWEGAGRGELVLQRCASCGVVQHPPRGVCVSCLGGTPDSFVASGRGRVVTFTVTNQNQTPGFAEACPYVLAYVELDEGPRLLTNIVDCDPDTVTVGMAVTARFVPVDREHADRADDAAYAVPVFAPA